jgi:hypothetical protein
MVGTAGGDDPCSENGENTPFEQGKKPAAICRRTFAIKEFEGKSRPATAETLYSSSHPSHHQLCFERSVVELDYQLVNQVVRLLIIKLGPLTIIQGSEIGADFLCLSSLVGNNPRVQLSSLSVTFQR